MRVLPPQLTRPRLQRPPLLRAGNAYPGIMDTFDFWARGDFGITPSAGFPLNDGDLSSKWAGRNGNIIATQNSEANQPPYTADAIGGRPGLTFNSDFLKADALTFGTQWTAFFVVKATSGNGRSIFNRSSSTVSGRFAIDVIYTTTGDWRLIIKDDTGFSVIAIKGAVASHFDNPVVVTTQRNGNVIKIRVNQTEQSASGALGAITTDVTTIGARRDGSSTANSYMAGLLSEIAKSGSVLSDTDIVSVEQYLSSHYHISF